MIKRRKKLLHISTIKQTTYSKYELGKINVPIDVFIKLADYYTVSIDYLVGRGKRRKITNYEKHAPRVSQVIAAVAKVSCKHGLWLVVRINKKSLSILQTLNLQNIQRLNSCRWPDSNRHGY